MIYGLGAINGWIRRFRCVFCSFLVVKLGSFLFPVATFCGIFRKASLRSVTGIYIGSRLGRDLKGLKLFVNEMRVEPFEWWSAKGWIEFWLLLIRFNLSFVLVFEFFYSLSEIPLRILPRWLGFYWCQNIFFLASLQTTISSSAFKSNHIVSSGDSFIFSIF